MTDKENSGNYVTFSPEFSNGQFSKTSNTNNRIVHKNNAVLYGLIAGAALLVFYLTIVSLFQNLEFALLNLRSLWYLIFPLSIGFGIQIGLYFSIKHTALINAGVAGTGGISAGSMIACCSHFLLNVIPFIGFSGAALFLMRYQKLFLGVGILSNIIGIFVMIKHKNKMKGGCYKKKNQYE